MSIYSSSIGGYGELELPYYDNELHHGAISVQSARSALYLYLKNSTAKVIYLPEYLCESIIPGIESLNIEIKYYQLTDQLSPILPNINSEHIFIVLVNYFGITTQKIEDAIEVLGSKRSQVVVDSSQSIFDRIYDCGAQIFSPRKFFGIPDGGYLYSSVDVKLPEKEFDTRNSLVHLLLRSSDQAHLGYQSFLDSEDKLSDFKPLNMSKISKRLLKSYDLEKVKLKRIENFKKLSDAFLTINLFEDECLYKEVPLCYPLKLNFDVTSLCKELSKNGIYLPRYWPGIKKCNNAVMCWYNNTLFLPVDHRLDSEQMNVLIKYVNRLLV